MSRLETIGREHGLYFSAADLRETVFPAPRWAVDGLLPEGLTLLVGAPKIGKSWLTLGLAVAVASGGVALGKIPVEPGDVLLAALEDPPRRLQSRLQKIMGSDPWPDRLHITTQLPRGSDAIDLIDEWLDAHPDARMVVVDVLGKVKARSDGRNLYEADYDALGELKALADRHRIAVVAVHHTRKSIDEGDVFNEVSGSTGLTGSADTILIVKRARNTAEAVLHLVSRDVDEGDKGMTWDPATCTWTLTDGPAVVAGMSTTRRTIFNHLKANEGDTPTAISEATGLPLATVKQTVRRMVTDDQLDTDGEGRYFPPKPLSPLSPLSPSTLLGDSGDKGDTVPQLALVPEESPR